MRSKKPKKTQSLLYVAFALLAVAMVSAIVITTAQLSLKTSKHHRGGSDADQLAMAGIELAKVKLTADWLWTMDTLNDNNAHRGGQSLDETLHLGDGQYWVRVEDLPQINPGEDRVRVTSHGWLGDDHKQISVVMYKPVATGQNKVYVAEYYDQQVHVINDDCSTAFIAGGWHPAWDMEIDPNTGDFWVVSYGATNLLGQRTVTRYSPNGVIKWQRKDLYYPYSIAVDFATGDCWVAEFYGHRVRKLDGNGNDLWTSATVYYPTSVGVDQNGNCWVSEYYYHRVRKLNPTGGIVWTSPTLYYPIALEVNRYTSELWVSEYYHHRVRKFNPNATGNGMTLQWTSPTNTYYPIYLAINPQATLNTTQCWVAMYYHHRVRKLRADGTIDPSWSEVTNTYYPYSLAVNSAGECWAAMYNHHRVRKLRANGTTHWTRTVSPTYYPKALAVDPSGDDVWVGGYYTYGYLRKLRGSNGSDLIVRGNELYYPENVVADPATGEFWVANYYRHEVAKFNNDGSFAFKIPINYYPRAMALNASGDIWIGSWYPTGRIRKYSASGVFQWQSPVVGYVWSLAVNPDTDECWYPRFYSHRVEKRRADGSIDPSWSMSTVYYPYAISRNSNTNEIWVSQYYHHRVSKLRANGTLEWNSPNNLYYPLAISVDSDTSECWVARYYYHYIQKLRANGTIAWNSSTQYYPYELSVNSSSHELWLSQWWDLGDRVKKFDQSGGIVCSVPQMDYPRGIHACSSQVSGALAIEPGSWLETD